MTPVESKPLEHELVSRHNRAMQNEILSLLQKLFIHKPSGDDETVRILSGGIETLLSDTEKERSVDSLTEFLQRGAVLVREELSSLSERDPSFAAAMRAASEAIKSGWNQASREALWKVFFPEGVGLERNPGEMVTALRAKRRVTEITLNPDPISSPADELLFTSNALLAPPVSERVLDEIDMTGDMKEEVRRVMGETQLYYYDHPIHIGTPPESNEVIYGLKGLDEAIAWEKTAGRVAEDTRATVVLSLSVTHGGLHALAKPYLQEEIRKFGTFDHLQVYLFTEQECRTIVSDVLQPFFRDEETGREVASVFGVDGEYGRHYSFLKAIAAFWHVFVNPRIRGTFKFDLDQVFPQRELEEESGESALQHFTTPLWGAEGTDSDGNSVDLGMIAGALVNEKDIAGGLFTPDVTIPDDIPFGEAAVFYNRLPMAVSTQAEMMTRYTDGSDDAILRYHVTGGTNGILVRHLRAYRPFTPSFVGRAEDQAYLLSVLFKPVESRYLRYLHKPGLIMRHDKEAFAGVSITHAKTGRFIGDLVRTYIFSRYVSFLPWDRNRTKEQIDPFTGCFVTNRVWTVVFLRLFLHSIELREKPQELLELLTLAERKLSPLIDDYEGANYLEKEFNRQQHAWDAFYDALDRAEKKRNHDTARKIIASARLI